MLGVGVAAHTGLDYPSVDVAMRRLGIDDPDGRLWRDLQHMEAQALPILNEVRE